MCITTWPTSIKISKSQFSDPKLFFFINSENLLEKLAHKNVKFRKLKFSQISFWDCAFAVAMIWLIWIWRQCYIIVLQHFSPYFRKIKKIIELLL